MKQIIIIVFIVLMGGWQLHPQPVLPSHQRDTSAFFPVGFYTFYICRGVPPFGYLPATGLPPTEEQMLDWIRRDSVNIKSVAANYLVDWIPHLYWHLIDPGPPIRHNEQPLENTLFRSFALNSGIRLDYKNNSPWMDVQGIPPSIQHYIQRLPQDHPPGDEIDKSAWKSWEDSVRNELLRIRDVVMNRETDCEPYHTFYLAHEVDIYPDLRDNLGDVSDAGQASRYAVQTVCRLWDDIYQGTRVKPFVVINALHRWPQLRQDIANTVRNLRMVAMNSYVIDPYVSTTFKTNDSRGPYRRGQQQVFRQLADDMTSFWKAFEVEIPYDRKEESLPIERWFIGHVHKNYSVDSTGWARTMADFDFDHAVETLKHLNGSATRYPTYGELRLQASLALSRGFKGILWYTYGSANAVAPLEDAPFGVVDSLRRPITHDIDLGMKPDHPCPEQVNPFENIALINEELHRIAPIFRKLELVDVFPQDTIPANCFGLNQVTVTGKYGDEAIDVSVFRRYDCDTCWYMMFVNKVLNDSDDPCHVATPKSVEAQFVGAESLRLVSTDGLDNPEALSLENGTRCSFSIEPGQGRLFRIEGMSCSSFHEEAMPARPLISFYPSPLSGTSQIRIELPIEGHIAIDVFNVLGDRVSTVFSGFISAGIHEFPFVESQEMSAGIYFARMQSASGTVWRKVAVVR